jgi:hypothetical protein
MTTRRRNTLSRSLIIMTSSYGIATGKSNFLNDPIYSCPNCAARFTKVHRKIHESGTYVKFRGAELFAW